MLTVAVLAVGLGPLWFFGAEMTADGASEAGLQGMSLLMIAFLALLVLRVVTIMLLSSLR